MSEKGTAQTRFSAREDFCPGSSYYSTDYWPRRTILDQNALLVPEAKNTYLP